MKMAFYTRRNDAQIEAIQLTADTVVGLMRRLGPPITLSLDGALKLVLNWSFDNRRPGDHVYESDWVLWMDGTPSRMMDKDFQREWKEVPVAGAHPEREERFYLGEYSCAIVPDQDKTVWMWQGLVYLSGGYMRRTPGYFAKSTVRAKLEDLVMLLRKEGVKP